MRCLQILAHFFIPEDLDCMLSQGLQSLRVALWNETYRTNGSLVRISANLLQSAWVGCCSHPVRAAKCTGRRNPVIFGAKNLTSLACLQDGSTFGRLLYGATGLTSLSLRDVNLTVSYL